MEYRTSFPADARGTGRFADWSLALKSILGFWLFYALTIVARALLSSDPLTIVQNKMLVIGIGILITAVIYAAIALAGGNSLRRKAVVAGVASLVSAIAMSGLLIATEEWQRPPREESRFEAREGYVIIGKGNTVRIERKAAEPLILTMPTIHELDRNKQVRIAADTAVVWLFFFVAWSAFYLAIVAQAEALGARRRIVEAESAARSAQVRALRYQVNPHFLFNTLNSLSALVMSDRPQEAEEMILKLSTFYRTSLSLEPTADITLSQEIELQSLYLEIEKVRFPKRLKVEISIPEDLESARVPALILQPIVENAIKHGVSGSRDTVILTISAHETGPGRFMIEVANSTATKRKRRDEAPEGAGVGIANVCDRIEARFGAAARCDFGPSADGGYRVALTLPLDRMHG